MKLTSIVILSFLILSNSLRVSFVYGWYTLDIDSFIEQLCENKDRPQLQCNGKCYLSKMLQEDSKEEPFSTAFIEWEQQVFYTIENISVSGLTSVPYLKHQFFYVSHYKDINLASIFHPPRYS